MIKTATIKTGISTALFALVAIATPVHASARADTTTAPQRVVDASDLDLTTAGGKATFDRRLAAAVKVVCAADEPSDLAGRMAVRACRSHARQALGSQRDAVIVAAAQTRAHAVLAAK
ncbi:UrcA family protein [Novosphingobium sp.]|uniref:UrcA family protein n=1 Tax=Novosphingobium sp. TaxID=1874826 RepID=UPI0025E0D9BF|nr:UrcA family protein [Novosphingobium sp.]